MSGILSNIYNNITYALSKQTDALFKLQEQSSTGSRINRVSDDPTDAYQVMSLDNEKSKLENYISSIEDMSGTLQTSSTLLQQMSSVISQAKVGITQVTSGVYDEQSRERMAETINNYLEQLVQLANTKYNGQYLFGGSNSSTKPYDVERTDGEITSVTYQGSTENRNVNVAPGVSTNEVYVGDELFRNDTPQTPVFGGTTGAAAGTGTSSVTGDVWLKTTFDGTNYQVSIDDGATWVSVPNGGSDNQAITDSRTGKVLYVDTTGIHAAGTELVRVPGTYDVFNTLINLRDLMRNDRNLSDDQLNQYRNEAASSLDEIGSLLVGKQVSVGAKVGYLDDLKNSLDNIKANNEDASSKLQQADIAQISIDLARHTALYQMSLSVAGKLMSMSLLDFIK
jgi:flagellar hook-associated protein 3 FlgL